MYNNGHEKINKFYFPSIKFVKKVQGTIVKKVMPDLQH